MTPRPNLAYRADIDGLRAISIVSVVLYHFGVPYMGGGFVGVDVFFVISGYLITGLVLAEAKNGTFSFARFYERRMRRLLPTFAAMLVATFAAGFFILTPQDLAEFCKSAVYTLAVASNLYFADQGGYFSPSLELAPLLHTWSLAVEEQFYIVWPIVLAVLVRYAPRYALPAAFLLLLASFAANVGVLAEKPIAAFYWPHTRFWELLVGCALALGLPVARARIAPELAGLSGLVLIAFAIFGFDSQMDYPGVAALVPVVGAALVIWSGQSGPLRTTALLRTHPMVFVGLVSYAWYLWHWPMIALFRYQLERKPDAAEIVVLLALSFALAVFCWHYLEKPIRRGAWLKTRSQMFAVGGASMLSLLAVAAAGFESAGFIARYPVAMQELTIERLSARPSDGPCARLSATNIEAGNLCNVWSAGEGRPNLLLWGDSHAGALKSVFRDMGQAADVSVAYAGRAACPPLIDAGRQRRRGSSDACRDLNQAVGHLLAAKKYTDVVLVARWNYYVVGAPSETGIRGEQHYLRDAQSVDVSLEENRAVIARGLRSTVDAIIAAGARPWLVLEPPNAGFNVPNRLARYLMRGEDVKTMFATEDLAEQKSRGGYMRTVAESLPVRFVDLFGPLCEGARCLAIADGKPLYLDDNHLSMYGAKRLAPLFSELFTERQEAAKQSGVKN